jgi:hypothetical protein
MKFRKKPVVIEAWHFAEVQEPQPEWLTRAMMEGGAWYQGGAEPYITIATLEGEMRANFGDWIIRGVKNELYPCKPDIFAATYEPAE